MTDLPPLTDRWIGRPAPRPSPRIRLFCLPYAGGGTAVYRPWADDLPEDIELCLVQLPGRETRMREAPYTSLHELVGGLELALKPLLDRPYAIFGHSMGALIALAITRQLRSKGHPEPEHLFIAGRRAPHVPDPDPPLHQLPDAAFVATLVRRYNGIPKVLLQNVDLLRLFLPTLRTDMTMIETYSITEEPTLEAPIAAFGGWEDNRATQVQLAAWREFTTGAFTLRMLPGGHFFIQSARAELVASIIDLLSPADPVRLHPPVRHTGLPESGIALNPRGVG